MTDEQANFAISVVATAPSPAASGTSLTVSAGDGAGFPTVPFNAIVGNSGLVPPMCGTAPEVVRVTAIATDTLTITRAQEDTSARSILVGDWIDARFTAKALIASSGSGVGFATGTGGTVTQLTSKSTGVTLNTMCGEITMHNAALAGVGAVVSFTLTNSYIAATDVLVINHVLTGTIGSYAFNAKCSSGSAVIYVVNTSGAELSEAIKLRFARIRAAIS